MQKTHLLLTLLLNLQYYCYCQNISLSVNGKGPQETSLLTTIYKNHSFTSVTALKKELDTLQVLLNKNGFINATLRKLLKKNDTSYVATFHLNTNIDTLIISYKNTTISEKLIQSIIQKTTAQQSFSIPFKNTASTLTKLTTALSKNGTPFTTLKLNNIYLISQNTLYADLSVSNNNEKRYLNAIIIKGYPKFPKSYLKHYLRIRKHSLFNMTKIQQQTNALKSLRFAQQIKPPEVLFTKDSTILYMYLKKKTSNTFDGFIGFNTEENSGNLTLNGFANLELTNNLNHGESLRIIYKNDNTNQRSLDANITLPYLFNTPFGTELDFNLFRKDSSFTTTQQKAAIFYQITQKHKVSTAYATTASNNLLKLDNFAIKDYSSRFYNFTYTFTSTTSINAFNEFNTSATMSYSAGNRTVENTTINQQLATLNIFKIFNLNPNNSILVKFETHVLNSKQFIENELLRFGGINSIRGFNENSLYANLFNIINSEYRYLLNQTIYIHSIIDIGRLKNDILLQKSNLYSIGFGFGMKTKSGILKLNYANGRSSEQPFKFSSSKIHMSLTTVF